MEHAKKIKKYFFTFILSMLASIFSCSTSFLVCAMLAVLLLAMGAVSQASCALSTYRKRRFKHPKHCRWPTVCHCWRRALWYSRRAKRRANNRYPVYYHMPVNRHTQTTHTAYYLWCQLLGSLRQWGGGRGGGRRVRGQRFVQHYI